MAIKVLFHVGRQKSDYRVTTCEDLFLIVLFTT